MTESLIELFQQIRDIPYRIALSSNEPDFSCTGKHKQLKSLLEEQGLGVRWCVCDFKWSDINLPIEVSVVPHDDNCTHAYLEILTDGDWKKVDATWDAPLHKILPISKWDGAHDTSTAVPCLSTYSPDESAKIIAEEDPDAIDKDLEKNGAFYDAFNSWLARERKAP